MTFLTNGLDSQYTYPCSKAQVIEAFGDELLESASFGLSPAFSFQSRYSPRPRVRGIIVLHLSVPEAEKGSLYCYRILKEEFDDNTRAAVAGLLKGTMRVWLQAALSRPETEKFGQESLLVEVYGGDLRLHQTRWR